MTQSILPRSKRMLALTPLVLGFTVPLMWSAPAAPEGTADEAAHDEVTEEIFDAVRAPVEQDEWSVPGMSEDAWDAALDAYRQASAEGQVDRPVLTVIDYSLPSSEPRMWVVDLERREVLFHELVAHGKASGEAVATRFSNEPNSNATSLGVFRTGETYHGARGYSLKLDGLEPGMNDKARDRGIVVHGSKFVNEEMVERLGRVSMSLGCPAVDNAVAKPLIETIKGGTLVVSYYPSPDWLDSSRFVASR